MTELRIVPTFHLRAVTPAGALKKYKEGNFPPVIEEKVNISMSNIHLLPKYSQDPREKTFLFQDKSGCKDIYTTLNQSSFKHWEEKGTYPPTDPCTWCRYPVGDNPVFIPIKLITGELWTGVEPHCSYQCCLANFRREQGLSFITRDPLYKDSEYLLKYLYAREYGEGKILRSALDWRLLDINGGPLTREEFIAEGISYARTSNLIVPVKVCYVQIKY